MAIYRFPFDSKYAGHTATVIDHDGAEVSGSPITLDDAGDGSLALAEGAYRAQVSNAEGAFGDGYSVVDGVVDILASIAAAGAALAITAAWFEVDGSGGLDGSVVTVPLSVIDDGRANANPGLADIDGEDNTVINVNTSGNYIITLHCAPRLDSLGTVTTPGFASVRAAVLVNGGSEPPAYYPVARALIYVGSGADTHAASAHPSISQKFTAGDTVSVTFQGNLIDADSTGSTWAPGDSYLSLVRISE